jgi:hypothetical protein
MTRSERPQSGITIDGDAYEIRPEVVLDVPRLAGAQPNVGEPATIETPTPQPGQFLEAHVHGLDGNACVQGVRAGRLLA